MQLTKWLLVEVALLLNGLAQISLTKSGFDHLSVIKSPLRLWAQKKSEMSIRCVVLVLLIVF
jgi:hypothetical protein